MIYRDWSIVIAENFYGNARSCRNAKVLEVTLDAQVC